jgi:hypothetical protein
MTRVCVTEREVSMKRGGIMPWIGGGEKESTLAAPTMFE